MTRTAAAPTLCQLADIADGSSAGFAVTWPSGERRGVLAVRRGERVFVYVNSCPHIGSPLDFEPGRFLNFERTHILCSTHGAIFRIEDGRCIRGPCVGKSLAAIPVEIRDGSVHLPEVAPGLPSAWPAPY